MTGSVEQGKKSSSKFVPEEKSKNIVDAAGSNRIVKTKKEKAPKSDKKQTADKAVDKTVGEERAVNDPTRLDIRVGFVQKAWPHPEAERLYCEEVCLGEGNVRNIASGLREFVRLEDFENQKVLVLANMKEKKLRGFPSHGMILCGKSVDATTGAEIVELLRPPADAVVGERVLLEGLSGEADAVMNTKTGKDPFVAVQPDFRLDDAGVAYYKNNKFVTSKGECTCATIRNGSIS